MLHRLKRTLSEELAKSNQELVEQDEATKRQLLDKEHSFHIERSDKHKQLEEEKGREAFLEMASCLLRCLTPPSFYTS